MIWWCFSLLPSWRKGEVLERYKDAKWTCPKSKFLSIEAMKRNYIIYLPSKQSFHRLRFLQKLGCQKPCWDQARLQ